MSRMVWVKEAHCEESPEITNSMVGIFQANSNGQVASIIKLTEKNAEIVNLFLGGVHPVEHLNTSNFETGKRKNMDFIRTEKRFKK